MAAKLKNLKVTKVDFVDQGANPDAHIKLFKRKDGEKAEPKGKPDSGADEPEKKEAMFKRFVESAAKMFGISNFKADNSEGGTTEGVTKSGAETFGTRLERRNLEIITNEIWDMCYALNTSLCSILTDSDLDIEQTKAAMKESLKEFSEYADGIAQSWAEGKASNISKDLEFDLAVAKSAYKRLGDRIAESEEHTDGKMDEGEKGDHKEMKIDKSKLTESERAFLESIEKRYGTEDDAGAAQTTQQPTGGTGTAQPTAANTNDETVAKALEKLGLSSITQQNQQQGETDDVFKGLNPVVKAQLEALMKFKEEAEAKELKEIAKKYAILGKTEDELLPVLKSTKAASQEAYDQLITTLDGAVAAVEKSGVFGEIGKSGHATQVGKSAAPTTTAEAKIDSIAKSYMEKAPEMAYSDAVAKAWEDNPDLMSQYEQEAGF
jgi:hypothetical protein